MRITFLLLRPEEEPGAEVGEELDAALTLEAVLEAVSVDCGCEGVAVEWVDCEVTDAEPVAEAWEADEVEGRILVRAALPSETSAPRLVEEDWKTSL